MSMMAYREHPPSLCTVLYHRLGVARITDETMTGEKVGF